MTPPTERSTDTNSDILVAWYGDDFTGASATMEVLAFAGLPSMLFLDTPSDAQLRRHPGLRAIGVASTARAQSPDWMDANLPDAFSGLAALNPGILHYKVCSTLDSSAQTGSIGRATEIGTACLGSQVVPVLIAAPQMERYQCFGHLFAGTPDGTVRLDRHSVMARHPVTPMTESDVARHISAQSERIDGLHLPFPALVRGTAAFPDDPDTSRLTVVAIDGTDDVTEAAAGALIWQARDRCRFVVGSQGVEYALVAHWLAEGALDPVPAPAGLGRAKRMITVSGSVSPTTAGQIEWAKSNGFASIEFDACAVTAGAAATEAETQRTVDAALAALSEGLDPLVHTAEGPDDPAVARFRAAVAQGTVDMPEANRRIGTALGHVLRAVLERSDDTRAVVSGGDTSGHATQQLGIYALSALAPTIPGASIFRAHADGPMDGLELALKGGQMGSPDYFGWVRDGGGPR